MPIQFRCNHCGQKLSISRKKAGSEVTCPECVHRVRVPTIEEALAKAELRKKEKEQARLAAEQVAAKLSASMPAFELPPPEQPPAHLSQAEMKQFDLDQAEQRAQQAAEYAEQLAAMERTAFEQIPKPDARNDVEITEDDDDSNLRLTLARPPEINAPDLSNSQAWQHHPNPWLNEDEEEDDFQLAPTVLEESGLDMTPMVDVTFLLLIFFMVTASFSTQKSLETSPPEPEDEGAAQSVVIEEIEEESVVVEIDEEDNIRVDDVAVSGFSELKDVLQSKISNEGKTEMLIEADVKSRHGTVVAVTDAGLEVQMQRIRRTSKKNED